MSWKKSVFSNLMWDAYTIITVVALVELSGVAAQALGGSFMMGLAGALVLAALVLAGAFLLYSLPALNKREGAGGFSKLLVGEAAFIVLFFVLGFVLRVNGIAGVTEGGAYYDAAIVAEGRQIPKMVHGAEYIYLQLLHMIFLLLGNKLAAAVWLQVILQLLTVLLFYFGIRKLAGVLPAMVMLGFFMCMGPVIRNSLTLSPEPLYLLLFSVGLVLLSVCRDKMEHSLIFLIAGLWIGFTAYLDIMAFLLLVIGVAMMSSICKNKISVKSRIKAFLILLAGTGVSFFVAVLADALSSSEDFLSVLYAWSSLYIRENVSFAAGVLSNGLSWQVPLIVFMCFGVVSYWFYHENESVSLWILMFCLTLVIQNYGILTERLSGYSLMLLFLTVAAGLGIRACFRDAEEEIVFDIPAVSGQAGEDTTEAEQPAPETTEADQSTPEVTEVEQSMPETTESEQPAPETTEADQSTPEVAEAEQPVPETTEEEQPAPETTEVEQPVPETTESEQPAPEVTESEQPAPEITDAEQPAPETSESEPSQPRFLENPLPLPKPHQKKILDYDLELSGENDDFDYPVRENDDFDIQ